MKNEKAFDGLGLSEEALKAINTKGFEEPTAIQALTIPVMLRDDTNIIAQAQTGTGKTAAFGLPLIDLIAVEMKTVQALILVPTRELAIQVSEEINSLRGKKNVTIVPIYGGQSIDQQLRRLKKGVHIVVGTPGRIMDHIRRKTLKLGEIEHLILDEADEMLNMGFVEDMEEIMKHTNETKRTLLFSATMPDRIKNLAKKYMDGYELLKVKKEQLTTHLTEQIYFEVKGSDKFDALCRIIDIKDDFYGLIFCRTRSDVDVVSSHLKDRGYDAESIHGDVSQGQREKTLAKFRKRNVNILVATDVAARGIDVNNLTHVINYALPHDPESYIHRIGRTGRAGHQGLAVTFITPSEYKRLMFIQRITKTEIKKSSIPRVSDIIKSKKAKIQRELGEMLQNEPEKGYFSWAKQLLQDANATETMAAVLKYCFEEKLNPDIYGDIRSYGDKSRSLEKHGKARLFVALGKKDRMTPRKLVDLIMEKAGVQSRQIDDVQVLDNFSFIAVPFEKAEQVISGFKVQGKKPLVSHVKSEDKNPSSFKSSPRKRRKPEKSARKFR
ncbi:MAG: DEAD/DEAH box helicase [Fibrobacteria bacterium]|nr:DEAD/DEAH box helicase [Fibrobacteria bacterium]